MVSVFPHNNATGYDVDLLPLHLELVYYIGCHVVKLALYQI